MSFKIERNDITKVHTDAIVNTANPLPRVGRGTDTAVYNATGMAEAFYGLPPVMKENCLKYTKPDMHEVMKEFDKNQIARKEREA